MDDIQEIAGFDEDMREIFESYLVEAREILDHLSQDLITLEKNPADTDVINNIFRGVHTLKGTSSFLGFNQISELSHTCEDLLNKLRKGDLIANGAIIDVLIEAHNVAHILLQRIESRNLQPIEISSTLEKLLKAMVNQKENVQAGESKQAKSEEVPPKPEAFDVMQQRTADSTIRVDIERLDDLMNLVGELVLARNRLAQATHTLIEKYERIDMSKNIADVSSQIDFVTTELQMAVMKTRMIPIEKVFNGLPLLARDLIRTTGKEVDLQIYGKETELDKSIIEELNDPLVHMLRNAIDHGIELPEERKKLGKPQQGTVVVNAERDGNYILITMEDDGRGIDAVQIKQRAVEKGLITETQAQEMSTSDLYNLIFIPGFSTKRETTSVSGRGVGMDIVRTNIAKLKGIVEIDSEIG